MSRAATASETAPDLDERRSARFRMTGEGYEYLAESDPHSERVRPVYVHRLAALAWGILDGLDDPRHVHHAEHSIPWLNAEWNLNAEHPDDHADHHLRSQ